MFKHLICGSICVGLLAVAATQLHAQTSWPTKPIRVIVPIATGGVTDIVVRGTSQALSARLGQTLVIDNRPGANGIVGGDVCAKAVPDGYTICILNTGVVSVNPMIYEKHPFDPRRDFSPISNLYSLTGALVVPASFPVKSTGELRALATNQPRSVNFGTVGPGSYPELFLAWLNNYWKTRMTGVPYKGGGPIGIALLAGEVQVTAAALGNYINNIQGGRLKAIAVSGAQRSKLLPNVPTFAEAGLGEFHGRLWWGAFAPAGTPAPIIAKLNAVYGQVFREPQYIEFLEKQAAELAVGSSEEFVSFVKADQEWVAALLKTIAQTKQ